MIRSHKVVAVKKNIEEIPNKIEKVSRATIKFNIATTKLRQNNKYFIFVNLYPKHVEGFLILLLAPD